MAASSQLAVSCLMLILIPLPVYSYSFSLAIIHRNSKYSPLRDDQLSLSSLLRGSYKRSYDRAGYIREAMKITASNSDNLQATLIPGSGEYLINLGVQSDKDLFFIADTGSDLNWMQCVPCVGCTQETGRLFNPKNSASYIVIKFDSQTCSYLPQKSEGPDSSCQYRYGYGDGSVVEGTLSKDTFIVGQHTFSDIIFGCTHKTEGSFDKKGLGLIGLGGGPLSLVRQIGKSIDDKFSYCLPSDNQQNAKGRIHFGPESFVDSGSSNVVTTPLIPGSPSTFYYLNLEGIKVADDSDIVTVKSATPEGDKKAKGNIIIDSGTTFTFLDSETLAAVENKVKAKVTDAQVDDPNKMFSLCFKLTDTSAQLPNIVFHFTDAEVVLPPSNAFIETAKTIKCLGFVSSQGMGVNIFGNIAQHNFHIGYDLKNNKLSLVPKNCADSE